MKKKVVLLRNVKFNYDTLASCDIEKDIDMTFYENEHVVTSEVVEVDFPELSNEDVVLNEIAVLDNQINKVMAQAEVSIKALKERKQELLAICHDEPVEDEVNEDEQAWLDEDERRFEEKRDEELLNDNS